jgi:hypothetical protein
MKGGNVATQAATRNAAIHSWRLPSGRHLAAGGEEVLKDAGGLGGEDAGSDFDLVVEFGVGEDFEAGAEGAALGIVGSVDEAGNARLDKGSGTHRARFEGDVESCVREAVIAENTGSFADDHNFGVGSGIVVANSAVAGASEDSAFVNEERPDGDFAGCGGGAGFVERELHEIGVVRHG